MFQKEHQIAIFFYAIGGGMAIKLKEYHPAFVYLGIVIVVLTTLFVLYDSVKRVGKTVKAKKVVSPIAKAPNQFTVMHQNADGQILNTEFELWNEARKEDIYLLFETRAAAFNYVKKLHREQPNIQCLIENSHIAFSEMVGLAHA